jgi:hypothetical protein
MAGDRAGKRILIVLVQLLRILSKTEEDDDCRPGQWYCTTQSHTEIERRKTKCTWSTNSSSVFFFLQPHIRIQYFVVGLSPFLKLFLHCLDNLLAFDCLPQCCLLS